MIEHRNFFLEICLLLLHLILSQVSFALSFSTIPGYNENDLLELLYYSSFFNTSQDTGKRRPMLRDVMRETREFPNFLVEEGDQLAELPQRFQQAFMQGLQQARQEMAQDLRHTLLKIVRLRYPQAQRLAKKQTCQLDDSIALRDLIVKMSAAQSIDEAVTILLEIDYEDEEVEV
jgi:hypothetical protein